MLGAPPPPVVRIDLALNPNFGKVLSDIQGVSAATPPSQFGESKRGGGVTVARAPLHTEDAKEDKKEDKKVVPDYAKPLHRFAELMVGALGVADVSQIWRWPEDDEDADKLDWQRWIDPKFQSCITEALLDLRRVSGKSFTQVLKNSQARANFLQFVKYEYSTTKLAMKGVYRQLDAKNDLTDSFRAAADFFRTWV